MAEPSPGSQDAVLGRQAHPIGGAILGGLAGVQQRLAQGEVMALFDARNYGTAGEAWLRQLTAQENGMAMRSLASWLLSRRGTPDNQAWLGQCQAFEYEVVQVNARGEICDRRRDQNLCFTESLGEGVALEMMVLPGGQFLMGAPSHELGRNASEGPQHRVEIAPFLMSKFVVTQQQWQVVAALPQRERSLEPRPSEFYGDDLPVEQVSWHDAVEFCARLSQLTKRTYRLPSEAEWEYACRAGMTTPFYFGPTITPALASYGAGAYKAQTKEVGSFPANGFGLFDMHGNVWEWCADLWHDNYEGAPTDGSAWVLGGNRNYRVTRGGSWNFDPGACRCASRSMDFPGYTLFSFGLRLVCSGAVQEQD